jgi:hypothetical protein
MSDTKISSISLYVVAVISLVVILFFYAGPKTVDIDELDARVEQLLTEGVIVDQPEDMSAVADSMATDSVAVDSLAAAGAEGTMGTTDEMEETGATLEEIDLKDHLTGWELMVYKRTDYALGWAYILLAIALIAALLFPLITIVSDVKAILRLLAVVAGAAVLLLLSYFVFASDTPIDILGYTGTDNSDPGTLKWIDTGLFSTYIIFGVALLSILYFEVAKLFK